MPRLISRQKQIPNGFIFYQPQTGWKAPPFASFDTIVNALIAHRRGNPFLAQKFGWPMDYETVATELDEFNAAVCLKMGWNDYVADAAPGGGPAPAPFLPPNNHQGRLQKLAAGARVQLEWILSKEDAVPADVANARAAVCATCPMNESGDWTSFFTVPISEAIRAAMAQRKGWELSTPYDDKLHVCSACLCPLPLKMHMPIDRILSRLPEESKAALHPECWIKKEGKF